MNRFNSIRISTDDVLRREIVERRLKLGANALIIIAGETNSGKSYSSIYIASRCMEMYGTEQKFTAQDVVFTPQEFIRRLKELQQLPDHGRGHWLVWDECGSSLSSRGSQTTENKLITELFEMLRSSMVSVIFTVPRQGMVDIRIRLLVHIILICIPIDRNRCANWQKNLSTCRFHRVIHAISPGEKENDLRTACPRFPVVITNSLGQKFVKNVRVPQIWMKKADENILREYEKNKQSYFDKCTRRIDRRLSQAEMKMSARESDAPTQPKTQPAPSSSPPITAPTPTTPLTTNPLFRARRSS